MSKVLQIRATRNPEPDSHLWENKALNVTEVNVIILRY